MGGFWTFCWRSLQSNPAAAIGGSVMTLAGISYQDRLRKIADNPPPLLTNHLVQLAIIAFGVLVLAYVFYSEAQRERASRPRPNWDMLKAIEYLVTRSRWSIGRLYSANTNHIILEDVEGDYPGCGCARTPLNLGAPWPRHSNRPTNRSRSSAGRVAEFASRSDNHGR